MTENDQIQPGFQPGIQTNHQIQQDNLIQTQQQIQEPTQQVIQQNNLESFQQKVQEPAESQTKIQKKRSTWLTKIISGIFFLLGIALIGLGIYGIFETKSDWHYSSYSIRDIIMDSGILLTWPSGIFFIFMGIMFNYTREVDAYYHPSRFTKILSGILWFLGISLIWSGLRNFALTTSETVSFGKILIVGGSITICGMGLIFLGRLLYSTKKRIHSGITLLLAITISLFFVWISYQYRDWNPTLFLIPPLLLYFFITTIIRLIKCFRLKKRGKYGKKMIDPAPEKKKVGFVTTIVLLMIIVINLIYGKFLYLRIPKVDESIFYRTEHQIPLPPEEDALIQLREYLDNLWDPNDIFVKLDGIYLEEINNKEISWGTHNEECIVVYSGGDTYCGTRVRNKKTLYRLLNRYSLIPTKVGEEYLSFDGNKVTIMEYLDKNELNLKNELLELDRILSLDYYIPSDEYLGVFPPSTQSYARASGILLQYYTRKKDWNMVLLVIKINYKIIDIANHIGGTINNLISIVLQGIINNVVNSSIKIYPQDVRMKIIDLLPNQSELRDNMVQETAKGEYVILNESKKENIVDYYLKKTPSMQQFLFHRPFYSKKDNERAMLYMYNMILNDQFNDFYDFEKDMFNKPLPIYNYYKEYGELVPRLDSFEKRLNYNITQINTLITNLKAGDFKQQFNEAYKEIGDYQFENYRLAPHNELSN